MCVTVWSITSSEGSLEGIYIKVGTFKYLEKG